MDAEFAAGASILADGRQGCQIVDWTVENQRSKQPVLLSLASRETGGLIDSRRRENSEITG